MIWQVIMSMAQQSYHRLGISQSQAKAPWNHNTLHQSVGGEMTMAGSRNNLTSVDTYKYITVSSTLRIRAQYNQLVRGMVMDDVVNVNITPLWKNGNENALRNPAIGKDCHTLHNHFFMFIICTCTSL